MLIILKLKLKLILFWLLLPNPLSWWISSAIVKVHRLCPEIYFHLHLKPIQKIFKKSRTLRNQPIVAHKKLKIKHLKMSSNLLLQTLISLHQINLFKMDWAVRWTLLFPIPTTWIVNHNYNPRKVRKQNTLIYLTSPNLIRLRPCLQAKQCFRWFQIEYKISLPRLMLNQFMKFLIRQLKFIKNLNNLAFYKEFRHQ